MQYYILALKMIIISETSSQKNNNTDKKYIIFISSVFILKATALFHIKKFSSTRSVS